MTDVDLSPEAERERKAIRERLEQEAVREKDPLNHYSFPAVIAGLRQNKMGDIVFNATVPWSERHVVMDLLDHSPMQVMVTMREVEES